ncbi:hypothetical protein PG989_001279 [Apiospora arundinis]
MFQAQQTVEPTISDDRTHGSLFDKRGDKWVALGPREPVHEAEALESDFFSSQPEVRSVAKKAKKQSSKKTTLTTGPRYNKDPSRYYSGDDDIMKSPPSPPIHHAPIAHQSKKRFTSEIHERFDSSTRSGIGGTDSPYRLRDPPRVDRPHIPRRNERTLKFSELDYESGDSSFGSSSIDVDEQKPSSHFSNPPRPMISQNPSATHGDLIGASSLPQNLENHLPLQLSAVDLQSVASHLGIPQASSSSLGDMQAYISDLHHRQSYTLKPRKHRSAPAHAPTKKLRGLIIHRVLHKEGGRLIYLDHPQWIEGETWVLMGKLPVSNVRAYLSKCPDVCFITCRNYKESSSFDPGQRDATGNISVAYNSEFIVPVEKHLASAIGKFLAFSNCESSDQYSTHKSHNSRFQEFSNDWLDSWDEITLYSPYVAFYQFWNGNDMERFMNSLNRNELPLFKRVAGYVMDEYRAHFATIESLVSAGKITNAYLPFLFKPGTIVVQGKGSDARGSLVLGTGQNPSLEEPQQLRSYTIDAWCWNLDSFFTKDYTKLKIQGIAIDDCSKRDIQEMDIRPKAHVDAGTLGILRNRGKWFWNCRKQQMVAYCEIKRKDDKGKDMQQTIDQRYMIDMKTYRDFHPKTEPGASIKAAANVIGAEAMEHDDPP